VKGFARFQKLSALSLLLPQRLCHSLTSFSDTNTSTMSDDEDIAALVIDNGSGMCKGMLQDLLLLRCM
jgi:hypothetical protein